MADSKPLLLSGLRVVLCIAGLVAVAVALLPAVRDTTPDENKLDYAAAVSTGTSSTRSRVLEDSTPAARSGAPTPSSAVLIGKSPGREGRGRVVRLNVGRTRPQREADVAQNLGAAAREPKDPVLAVSRKRVNTAVSRRAGQRMGRQKSTSSSASAARTACS